MFPCEPLSNIGSCFVTNLLFFAFEDKAFSTIKNLDDLETLMRHATAPLRLAFDSAVLSTPILRSYSPHPVMRTSKSSSWTVSPQRAMTYGCLYTQLVKLGLRAGFQSQSALHSGWSYIHKPLSQNVLNLMISGGWVQTRSTDQD